MTPEDFGCEERVKFESLMLVSNPGSSVSYPQATISPRGSIKIMQTYTFMMTVHISGYRILKEYAVTVFFMDLNETSFGNLCIQ